MTEPREWPETLLAALRRVKLPVSRVIAADGGLEVALDLGGEQPLEVTFRPRAEGGRSYRRTERFSVSYRGPAGTDGRRRLDGLIEVIARLEHRFPAAWPGWRAAGAAPADPWRDLARRFPFAQLDRATASEEDTEVLLRLTERCNQQCPFCSAPPVARATTEALQACIDWVSAELPGACVTLTGGEPTLRGDFAALVGRALSRGARVRVQTNAVRFASRARLDALPRDARLRFFVSLHAMDPGIYDRCTGSQGQLPLALEGLRNLAAAGYPVTVNTVASAPNLDHLPAIPVALRAQLAEAPLPTLHWSVLMCPAHRPDATSMLVPYARLVPALEAAVAAARREGFAVDPLIGSTHASLPACQVPPHHRACSERRSRPQDGETGYEDDGQARPWVKAATCRGCAEDDRCLGVPAAYAARFGLTELQPLG